MVRERRTVECRLDENPELSIFRGVHGRQEYAPNPL